MASNIAVKDAAGTTQTVKTTETAGVHTPHHNVDSSALPTGAATAAKQPALGTAGAASADVISIQGIGSMTPVQIDQRRVNGSGISTGNGVSGAGVQRVTLASDGTGVVGLNAGTNNIGDVDVASLPTSGTGTRTQVADTVTDGVILASNTSRKGATIFNDSSAVLYLGLGTTTVTSTDYTLKIASGGYYEVPFNFTGEIRGLWATDPGDGGAKVTELT